MGYHHIRPHFSAQNFELNPNMQKFLAVELSENCYGVRQIPFDAFDYNAQLVRSIQLLWLHAGIRFDVPFIQTIMQIGGGI